MITRKSEWLASIRPILERDEAKRDAKELARELGDLLEINIDASPESLKKLTDEFNKQLSQIGKQPIVFSETTLHGIVNQFANAMKEGFSKGASAGMEETFKIQLANLQKEKEALIKEQNDINKHIKNRYRLEKIGGFRIESVHGLPIDEDVVGQAETMLNQMYEYADRISELQVGQGKESQEYISTVLDAQESYNKFLRLRKSLINTNPALPKDLKAAYGLLNLDEKYRYRAAGGHTTAFDEDPYGGAIILDAFEELDDVLINADDQLGKIQTRLTEINRQIESIVAQARASGVLDDALFVDSKNGLKTLKEIEMAYDRIFAKNKKTGGKTMDGLLAAVNYVPGSESLAKLKNHYNNSLSSSENWEEQYQWLVKFVKEYENYSAQIEAEADKVRRKNMMARQRQYTSLYEELKPMAENAETMLRGIVDLSNGKRPTGTKDTNKQDGSVKPTPEDVALERQAREEAEAKAKAEAEAAEAARKKRVEEEKAAKAAAKAKADNEAAAAAAAKMTNINSVDNENISNIKTNSDNIKTILGDMNNFLSSNNGAKIIDYFAAITTGAHKMSNDVRSAIEATIGSIETLQSISIGANNYGGLIGDKSALILRKPHFDVSQQKWSADEPYAKAIELQNRLNSVNISDVNLGKIQEIIKAEEYLVELQSRVSGAPISTIGEAIETINPEMLKVTEASVRSLIQAMHDLYAAGVEVDVENLGNVLFDGQSGKFGLVDMDVHKEGNKYGFGSFEEEVGAFAQTVRDQIGDISDPNMVQKWTRFADIVDTENNALRQQKRIIHGVIDTQKQLNAAESQNPQTSDAVKKEAVSYDELRQKVEAFAQARQKMLSLMDQGQPWQHLLPKVNAAQKDVAGLFPETGDNTTVQASWVNNMLTETLKDEKTLVKELAAALGIEIPQAAQQAESAINGVAGAQEKLNSTEAKNPPAQNDADVHNANATAINAEANAQERLNTAESQNPTSQSDAGVHNENANAIQNEALAQEQLAAKIKKTQSLIKNQQAWLKTLDPYLNDANYQTSGKKDATEQLKDATRRMVSYRRDPSEYAHESMAEEKRIVNWYKSYQEAQRQGVADSTLHKNDVGIYQSQYEQALQALQKERDYRAQVLQKAQAELQVLQQQANVQEQINATKTQEPKPVENTTQIQNENAAIDEQNGKLQENINLKTQSDIPDGTAEVSEENAETQAIQQQNQALQQKITLLKEIANAYTTQHLAQDAYDNADTPKQEESAERKLEAAKETVGDFERQYHSAMVTMQDGSKINIPLDDEFAESAQRILTDASKIQNVDLVPKSAEAAIQAYERIGMIQNNVMSALNRSWSNAVNGKSADVLAYLGRTRADLEASITNMNQGDPTGQWDLTNAKQSAMQLLSTIESLQPKFAMILQMEARLKKLNIAPDASRFYDVIEGIKNGTFTTVDQCIAKFKELSGIVEQTGDKTTATGVVTTGTTGTEITPSKTIPVQIVPDGATSAETTELEAVRAKILEVTNAVNTKTQAFTAEESEVKRVVASEIGSLNELEQKVLSIKGTLEGLLSNLKTGQSDVGAGLSNVTVNVNKTDGTDAEQKGSWALDTTAQSVRTSVDGVRTDIGNVITAISNINTQQTTPGADATLATEATLDAVKAVLDAINGKIVAGTKGGAGKQSGGKTDSSSEKKSGESQKKPDNTNANKKEAAAQTKKIETLRKEIGSLQGEANNVTNESVRKALQEEIALREHIIQLIQEGSAMSAQEEARQTKDLSEKTKAAKANAKEEEKAQKKASADQEKAQKKAYDDFVKDTKKEAGMTQTRSTISKADETLKNAALIDGATPEATAKFQQLNSALQQLSATYNEINSKEGPVDPKDQQRLIAQRESVKQLQGAVAELVAEHQRLNGVNSQKIGTTSLGIDASSETQEKAITKAVMAATKGRAAIKGFSVDTNELTYTLKTGANQFTTFRAAIDKTNGSIMTIRGNTTKTLGVFASIGKKLKEYSYYFTGSMMIYRAIAWVREGITAVKEIDTALTELKKVTDATEESYEKFLDTAAKTADKVGSTIKEVVSSTADWARLNI